MPKNMSPANQRQNSKRKGYYDRLRTDGVVEQNQMRKLLRHAARQGIHYLPTPNVGEMKFVRSNVNGKPHHYSEMEAAWKRAAAVTGIGKARAICGEFALRRGHWGGNA